MLPELNLTYDEPLTAYQPPASMIIHTSKDSLENVITLAEFGENFRIEIVYSRDLYSDWNIETRSDGKEETLWNDRGELVHDVTWKQPRMQLNCDFTLYRADLVFRRNEGQVSPRGNSETSRTVHCSHTPVLTSSA